MRLCRDLTVLLKKDNYNWSEATDLAIQELKRAMSTTPLLALPDFSLPFTIEIDACYGRIKVVLMQNRMPLACLIKGINSKKLGISIYENELLALATAASGNSTLKAIT